MQPSLWPIELSATEQAIMKRIKRADLACQQVTLRELHIDRASLSRTLVRERSADLQVSCKAWKVAHKHALCQNGLSTGLAVADPALSQ